jgi:hypothetical protein
MLGRVVSSKLGKSLITKAAALWIEYISPQIQSIGNLVNFIGEKVISRLFCFSYRHLLGIMSASIGLSFGKFTG